MEIRIQPLEIVVPKDDPFVNDKLERRESAEVLTHLVGRHSGPCVLAVDAEWGNGKTTFLKMWSGHLRNEAFHVIEFNAWETDFSGEPFVALCSELTKGLQQNGNDSLTAKINDTKKVATEILRRAVPGAIRLATAGVLDGSGVLDAEAGKALGSFAEDRLTEYGKAQESIGAFRKNLQEMADDLSGQTGRPLIVMIDELDRCRPSYAVELIEVAKHLFSVNNIVFVLAVNRAELIHSIRAVYGGGFDGDGYLRRFFDVDIRLPEPKRVAFIDMLLDTIRLRDYFRRTGDQGASDDENHVRNQLLRFFGRPDLSLRQVAQGMHRLGLVLASLRSNEHSYAMAVVVALVVRTIDAKLYHRFCRGDASDLEVVDSVFGRPGIKIPGRDFEGCLFEVTIIQAGYELSGSYYQDGESYSSKLVQRYRDLIAATEGSDDPSHDVERGHSMRVIELVGDVSMSAFKRTDIGFRHSVKRIELLSEGLVDKSSE